MNEEDKRFFKIIDDMSDVKLTDLQKEQILEMGKREERKLVFMRRGPMRWMNIGGKKNDRF